MSGNDFVKGRTNNHLTFMMVDATDFATPESALSAAIKIKIWGKLRGATGVNFVSSGTGSLTNDIQHVGPSVLGLYTIALAKADLSDASAAWYDQYITSLSATGAAYQTIISDGGIDTSKLLSQALVTLSGASDAQSAATQANSRVLLIQSRLSDLDSRLASDLSDVLSGITALSDAVSNAYSAAVVGASRVLLVQSRLSDFDSRLVSDVSDIRSMLSDMFSDFQSRVPKLVATNSQLSDLASDVKSAVAAVTATVSASDISDIASAVWANTIGARVDSRILVIQSMVSDVRSHVSDLQSDFQSRVPKRVATDSQLSDLASDIKSAVAGVTATLGASDISDIASAVKAILASDISDILSAAVQTNSRVLVVQSIVSDVRSHVSDLQSDFQSRVPKRVATDSQISDLASDLKSAIGGITVSLDASNISDIASAVVAALPITSLVSDAHSAAAQANSRILVIQSRLSDLDSRLVSDLSDVQSAVAVGNSRALLIQSIVSDVRSHVSDLQSDFQSRVPKRVATDSQLSDLHSDLKSHLAVSSGVQSDIYSLLSDLQSDFQSRVPKAAATASALALAASVISDAHSAATQASSRALVVQSHASDIYSLLSDLHSDVGVQSGVLSDVYSLVVAGAPLGASDLSDLRSAITANGVQRAGVEPTAVIGHTDTLAAKVDWLAALSRNKITQTATVQSLRNDADSADIASAAVSDDGTTFTRGEFGN